MLNIGFLLYHTGETKALLPALQSFAMQPSKYQLTIIPVGVSAQNLLPTNLKKFSKTPLLIKNYLGLNDDYTMHFSPKYVSDIIELLQGVDVIISGSPAQIQYQVLKALPQTIKKIIIFDGPYQEDKIKILQPHSDTFIFTDQKSLAIAQKKLGHKTQLFCARHGDFDIWLSNHHKNIRNRAKIRNKLNLTNKDKIILWLGGYGDLSEDDQELKGFANFLEVFQQVKDQFKLRITIHPGLQNFNQIKQQRIINKYYITQLQDYGNSKKQALETISNINSCQIASLASGVVSVNSTAAQQAIYIGTPAKYIYVPNQNLCANIEVVKTNKRWQEVFADWANSSSKQSKYLEELNKLAVPLDSSIEQTLKNIMTFRVR